MYRLGGHGRLCNGVADGLGDATGGLLVALIALVRRRSRGVASGRLALVQLNSAVLHSTRARCSSSGQAHQRHQADEGNDKKSTKGRHFAALLLSGARIRDSWGAVSETSC